MKHLQFKPGQLVKVGRHLFRVTKASNDRIPTCGHCFFDRADSFGLEHVCVKYCAAFYGSVFAKDYPKNCKILPANCYLKFIK